MIENQNPSRNIANDDEMPGMFLEILQKFLANNVDDFLPAVVENYDFEKNRATVKPLIMKVSTNNEAISRAALASIPVLQIGGGGYMMHFKPKKGDLGWIKANDRDISLFLQSYEEARPNTLLKHSFDNALFIPDVMRGYDTNKEDGCVLQAVDGSVKISLQPNAVKIIASNVDIETDNATITASSSVEVDTPVANFTGQVTLGGAGGLPIARINDEVEVMVTAGSSAGTYKGKITKASLIHTAT